MHSKAAPSSGVQGAPVAAGARNAVRLVPVVAGVLLNCAPDGSRGIVDRFTSIGWRPINVTERLHSRIPPPSEAAELRAAAGHWPGIPVIVAVRICHSGETAIEAADLLFAANQFKLEHSLTVERLN